MLLKTAQSPPPRATLEERLKNDQDMANWRAKKGLSHEVNLRDGRPEMKLARILGFSSLLEYSVPGRGTDGL